MRSAMNFRVLKGQKHPPKGDELIGRVAQTDDYRVSDTMPRGGNTQSRHHMTVTGVHEIAYRRAK